MHCFVIRPSVGVALLADGLRAVSPRLHGADQQAGGSQEKRVRADDRLPLGSPVHSCCSRSARWRHRSDGQRPLATALARGGMGTVLFMSSGEERSSCLAHGEILAGFSIGMPSALTSRWVAGALQPPWARLQLRRCDQGHWRVRAPARLHVARIRWRAGLSDHARTSGNGPLAVVRSARSHRHRGASGWPVRRHLGLHPAGMRCRSG